MMMIPEHGRPPMFGGAYVVGTYYELDGFYVVATLKTKKVVEYLALITGTEYKVSDHTRQTIICDKTSKITYIDFETGYIVQGAKPYVVTYPEFNREPKPVDKPMTPEEQKSCKKHFGATRTCKYQIDLYVGQIA